MPELELRRRFATPPPKSIEIGNGDVELETIRLHKKIGFIPDAKQALVLASQKKRIILNCSRQWGKSSVLAARAFRLMTSRPESLVLVVARDLSQTGETIRKMDRFFAALRMVTRGEEGKSMARELAANGSRVLGLAAVDDSVRSYTADLVMIDEAARVDDEVWDAIEPTLATTNGPLIVASTPRGIWRLRWHWR